MSDGTRSGVNWMRAKSPPTTVANVRTASVFAVPGTPSSSTWPLASSPTMSCSTMCSCPTMTRWTSAIASVSSAEADATSPAPAGWLVVGVVTRRLLLVRGRVGPHATIPEGS